MQSISPLKFEDRSLKLKNEGGAGALSEPVYMEFSKRGEKWPRVVYQIAADELGSVGVAVDTSVGDEWGQGFDAEFWIGIRAPGYRGWRRFRSDQTGESVFHVTYGHEAALTHVSRGNWVLTLTDSPGKAVVHTMSLQDLPLHEGDSGDR